jgi:hypothetical protein
MVAAMLPGMMLPADDVYPGITVVLVRRYMRPELSAKRVPATSFCDNELKALYRVTDPVALVWIFLPRVAGTVVEALPVMVTTPYASEDVAVTVAGMT